MTPFDPNRTEGNPMSTSTVSTSSVSTSSVSTPSSTATRGESLATPTAGGPDAAAAASGRPGIPFGRLLHLELRKLVDTRAGRWLLIITLGLVVIVNGASLIWGDPASATFESFAGMTGLVMMLLLPVLGILAATSEFSQRTGLVTFTQEPRRVRVVAAKTLAALLVGAASIIVSLLIGALVTGIAIVWHDPADPWQVNWTAFAGTTGIQLLNVLQGVAFGLLLTIPAAAIATFFILPTAWTFAAQLFGPVRDLAPWIDLGTATGPLMQGEMTGSAWAHLATAAALWIALPLLVGTWRLVKREIK